MLLEGVGIALHVAGAEQVLQLLGRVRAIEIGPDGLRGGELLGDQLQHPSLLANPRGLTGNVRPLLEARILLELEMRMLGDGNDDALGVSASVFFEDLRCLQHKAAAVQRRHPVRHRHAEKDEVGKAVGL